jgi:hypothetical protein
VVVQAVHLQGILLGPGDIAGQLDHFGTWPFALVMGRIIASQPYFGAGFGETLEFALLELTFVQIRPELGVLGAFGLLGVHEDAVVLAHDFGGLVAHPLEEGVVGKQNVALLVKLDVGVRSIYGLEQAFHLDVSHLTGEISFLERVPVFHVLLLSV